MPKHNHIVHMYLSLITTLDISPGKIINEAVHVSTGSLPENILSRTRGTAQKIVGFSTPISSTSSLTSCDREVNSNYRPKGKMTFR